MPNVPLVGLPPGSLPTRLRIPRLGVDAPVEHVGLTAKRDMDAPKDPWNVAWYMLGALPGQRGNAVISGHLDSLLGPAVFWDLKSLQAGDDIFVTDEGGVELHFVVTDKELYGVNDAPLEEIFGRSDRVRLNLITCDGTWNQTERRYSQRLTVFAEMQDS